MSARFPRFGSLQDWLRFCRQEETPDPVLDAVDQEYVEEIQQAVRTLTRVLDRHEDARQLANLWFSACGSGRWRLVLVVGERTRA